MSDGHVAGGASTLSKYPELFPEAAPRALRWASGTRVCSDTGETYTDWISGLLAVTLGYRHPEVTEAVCTHLRHSGGPSWSLPHALEEEVAATIARLCGKPEGAVRFFKTGSEACSAAVRIARAVTGQPWVLGDGYHGWHDTLIATPPAWGVIGTPEQRWVSTGAWEGPAGSVVAARILEPVTTERPNVSALRLARELATQHGALLIFDECITGGRYPEFTAGRHYGVEPDLYVLSKGLANGFPLACVVGSREVMRCFDVDWRPSWSTGGVSGPVYCSGTWSGETVGLAAAQATLAVWAREHVAERLWATGTQLQGHLQARLDAAHLGERVRIKGQPYRLVLDCPNLQDKTAIMTRLLDLGHLIGAGWNVTAAHTLEDVRDVAEAFAHALTRIDAPAGRSVVAPYRQQ